MNDEEIETRLKVVFESLAARGIDIEPCTRDRRKLLSSLENWSPPTQEELAEAEANAGKFREVLDELAAELGVK